MLTGHDWLEHHLETFVRPNLKKIPVVTRVAMNDFPLNQWKPVHLKALHATWKEAKKKAKSRQILLAGRDVYLFEVLARLEGFPTIFRPDISGPVAKAKIVKEDYTQCYLLDTGYAGTVPKALGIENFGLISCGGSYNKEQVKHQIFPKALALAGILEGVSKYWTQAGLRYHVDPKACVIIQTLSDDPVFTKAAIMTQYVAASVGAKYKVRGRVMSVGRGV